MSIFRVYIYQYNIKSIFIIYFLTIIAHNKCEDILLNTLEYKYPNCIELNNGNILIIFSEGIYIYNSQLSEEIDHINYESNFTLGVNDLNLINLSKFDDGVVICIIKIYIYLFSSTGEYIYHDDLSQYLQENIYYSLVPHKIEGNKYYYVISYIDSSLKIIFYYYNINISEKTNNLINNSSFTHTDSNYKICSQGLTCQLMSPLNSENILICFYEITYPNGISVTSFQLDNYILQDNSIPIIYQSNEQYGFFKSAITKDRKKALICHSNNGNGGNCFFYNIINNTISQDIKYFTKCCNVPRKMHVDYFAKTKEFIFSCSDGGLQMTIIKFDEEGKTILNNTTIKPNYNFNSGYELYTFSILFISNYSQYSIIYTTDINYLGNANCKHILLPENLYTLSIYDDTEESNSNELFNYSLSDLTNSYDEFLEEKNYSDFLRDISRKKNNIDEIDDIILKIKNFLNSDKTDHLLPDINKGKILGKDNYASYQIITTNHQGNNYNKNISKIKLNKCEQKLRKHYKMDDNEVLLLFKVDIYLEGLLIPKVEYELYNHNRKLKLDLNVCNDTKIDILYPVLKVEDDMIKHNLSSEFYNDICFTYTTEDNTDITLRDRRKEFINKNLSLCESNCDYNGYDIETKESYCNCEIKINIPLMSEITIDKDKLKQKFINITNILNLNVMKCYKLLFTKEGIKNNIGSYILLFIIFIIIILIFIFVKKERKSFYFYNIFSLKHNNLSINKISKPTINKKSENLIKNTVSKIKLNKNRKKQMIKKCKIKLSNKSIKSNSNLIINNMNKLPKITNKKDVIEYNDYEINELSYQKALILDKRSYHEYYLSLLRKRQILIFTFYTYNDYNPRITKICFFLFAFSLYYIINALFFNESTMHRIYKDKGKFNFIYQIPQILYSTIISSVINAIINYLSLTEKIIISLKNENKNIEEKVIKTLKCLKIKFSIFFILTFLILIFFWYYISCFCVVYNNTQVYIIKDTFISYILSLFYPFFLCLLPGIIRIPILRTRRQNNECLYKFSQLIQ